MRLAAATAALAVGVAVTTLPRPPFPGPATNVPDPHRLVVVSSRYRAPGSLGVLEPELAAPPLKLRGLPLVGIIPTPGGVFQLYGKDAASARYLLAPDRYAFDFKNVVWPPRIRPGEREFVYEQVVWARETGGTLYVENAHSTYASSSYGRNAYITAIDLKTKQRLWRSRALVANANNFLVSDDYVISGYGFTDEPDYLYLLDRRTGRIVDRLGLPTAPERITWRGKQIHVRTYDHDVVVRLRED
jgi:hypothetical protein